MTMDEINRCINMANEWSAKAMELVDSINKMDLSEMASEDIIEPEVDEVDETSSESESDSEEDEKNKLLQEDRNLADDLADLEKKLSDIDQQIDALDKEHDDFQKKYDAFINEYDSKRIKLEDEQDNLYDQRRKILNAREDIYKKWCEKFCKPTTSGEASSPKNEAVKKTSKPKIPSTSEILGYLECYFGTKLDLVDPYSSLNKLLNGKIKTVKFINGKRQYDLDDIAGILANVGEEELSNEVNALADYYANEKQEDK